MPMSSGEIPAGPLEQGVALSRRRGLREHSGGLVDNQDLRILIKDVQPSGRCAGAGPIGMVDKLCLRLNLQRRLETRLTVDVHLALPHGFVRTRRTGRTVAQSACLAASMSFFPALTRQANGLISWSNR